MKLRTLLVFFSMTAAVARAETPGEKLAQTCAACHGRQGQSQNDVWPNLAGQKQNYLIKQLNAFQKGERFDPLMSPIAKSLSDSQIKILAEYFAKLKAGS